MAAMTRRDVLGRVAGIAAAGAWTVTTNESLLAAGTARATAAAVDGGQSAERIRWWQEARFGMFIHWGLYAVPGHGEWMMHQEHVPPAEYALLADQFHPQQYSPKDWAAIARDAGMRYMVLTTRHHDGFCLFDGRASDFTSTKTAAKRDLVAEYVEACRQANLGVGLYYSLIDWRFPGAMFSGSPQTQADFSAMVEQAHAQVRELMTNYGKIDILWYDGGWPGGIWRAEQLNAMVRQLQPDILINHRAGPPEDFATSEQNLEPHDRPWEACITMNDTWGYNYSDRNYKTPCQVLHTLCDAD